MTKLKHDTRIQRSDKVLHSDLGGKAVMMDIEAGCYFSLNGVATRLWELLATPHTVAELVAQLLDEYEVKPEVCEEKVRAFADDLLEKNLLVRLPESGVAEAGANE